MFSGKSTKLLTILKDLIENGYNDENDIIVVNHINDNRFETKEYIVSHN